VDRTGGSGRHSVPRPVCQQVQNPAARCDLCVPGSYPARSGFLGLTAVSDARAPSDRIERTAQARRRPPTRASCKLPCPRPRVIGRATTWLWRTKPQAGATLLALVAAIAATVVLFA